MSWTNECIETNYFKVKHIDEVRDVIERLGLIVSVNKDSQEMCFYNNNEGEYFDDNAEVVLSIKPTEVLKDNNEIEITNLIEVISDNTMETLDEILEINNLKQSDICIQNIVEYLQDELIDEKQAIIITTSGFESRFSGSFNPFGEVYIITKKYVDFMSLYGYTMQKLKEFGTSENQ